MSPKLIGTVGSLFALCGAVRAGDWPQFRGPQGTAVSTEAGLPTVWGADQNIAWKVKLPGYGWSCPVVWGDKVFLTTASSEKQSKPTGSFGGPRGFQNGPDGPGNPPKGPDEPGGFPRGPRGPGGMRGKAPDAVYKWDVYCLNAADGKTLWKQTAAEKKPAIATNHTNGYATETPATDGERLYAYFGGIGTVFCFDLSGKPVWQADIGAHAVQFGHGTASSPAVAGGRVFVQCDNDEKSFLVALDARTGAELWRTPRDEGTTWSSPLVWENAKRAEVVCVGSPKARAYDPATGKQLWELGGVTGQIKASPVASRELLYLGSGGGFGGRGGPGRFSREPGGRRPGGPDAGGGSRPLFAVKAGASGDISLKPGEKGNTGVEWHLAAAGPTTASPVLYEGNLYVLEQGGTVGCYNAKTGAQIYRERVPGARGFTASPWAYEGRVFCLDDGGTTHVLKAGPEFEALGANKLGEMAWSSPAVAGGALFIRTVDHLFCIRQPGKTK